MKLLPPRRNLEFVTTRGQEESLFTQDVDMSVLDFVTFGVCIRDKRGRPCPITFDGRRYLTDIYNREMVRIGFEGGRQVEKTTFLAADALSHMWLNPSFTTLYVCPTFRQVKTFSEETVDEMVSTSFVLGAMIPEKYRNITTKRTETGSKMHLRHAFLHADRVRGIPGVNLIQLDEIQDLIVSILPVVLETMSHSPVSEKRVRYAGTHKTADGTIEQLKKLEGVCHEWVIPCDRHTPRVWNITGSQTVGKKGNICSRCKKPISPAHPDAQWAVVQKPQSDIAYPINWFRVNQLMVPWSDWDEILDKIERYPTGELKNEVFAEPHAYGTRPITKERLLSLCKENFCRTLDDATRAAKMFRSGTFMGIDWGAGTDTSKTFVTVMAFQQKYRLLYASSVDSGTQVHFADDEMIPEDDPEMAAIDELIKIFNPQAIGVDHGLGYKRNSYLARKYGSRRIKPIQALGGAYTKKFAYNSTLYRYMYSQPEAYDVVFSALEHGEFIFMDQEASQRELIPDILNVIREGGDEGRRVSYTKILNSTDDGFSSLVLVLLASLITYPRPDLLILEYEGDGGAPNPYLEV